MRAARATDLARATPRPTGGDGDGLLADGRTPVECRAHRVLLERRQRHAARVEPVGRGGPNGGGVALRPLHEIECVERLGLNSLMRALLS